MKLFTSLVLLASVAPVAFAATTQPSSPRLSLSGNKLTLIDGRISAEWTTDGSHIQPASLTDAVAGRTYDLGETKLFQIILGDEQQHHSVNSADLTMTHPLAVDPIAAKPDALCLADREAGTVASATFAGPSGDDWTVDWKLIARTGENYFREEVAIHAGKKALPVQRVTLLNLPVRFPWVCGTVNGSPIVSDTLFCGVEHPSAENEIADGNARGSLERTVPLEAGQTLTLSAVVGVAREGQLRRDFQSYVNNERPRPYSPFLHYNSWYDLGYFTPFNEKDATAAINTLGDELSTKRGVTMKSFLFDDGWDNHQTLWDFNAGFPNGFTPLMNAAAQFHAGVGVWLSPWGGYSKPKQDRLKYGKTAGYETNDGGFALSGPKYYERFRSVCLQFIEKFGVNQFKFDGTGNVSSQMPGSKFGTDFDAMISLIGDLRSAKPDLYVNLTTGTWPSPFWTRYADSIWRGGEDHTFAGVGTWREKWITYRDGDEYHGIVKLGPLFPMNSLMLHGIIYAKHARHLGDDPSNDFADEVHDYFGTGTQCQELYMTGALLSKENWDTLGEAAKWSADNAETLKDVHWVGGDPTRGELYGYAAWSPAKGILTLRNPSDQPQSIDLDPAEVFELPADGAKTYSAHSPWKSQADQPAIELKAGTKHHFELRPFDIVTIEAVAK